MSYILIITNTMLLPKSEQFMFLHLDYKEPRGARREARAVRPAGERYILGVQFPIQQHSLSTIFPVVYQDQHYIHLLSLKALHRIPENRPQRTPVSLNVGNTLATCVSVPTTPYITDSTASEPLQPDKYHWWETVPALQYPLQH